MGNLRQIRQEWPCACQTFREIRLKLYLRFFLAAYILRLVAQPRGKNN